MENLFGNKIHDVTGVISHDFLNPMLSLDPSIMHIVLFQFIEFYRSKNPVSDIIWLSSSFPTLPFIDSIKYMQKEGEYLDFIDEIQHYRLPEYKDAISLQRQRVGTLIEEIARIKTSYLKTLIVIDDMDQMIKTDDPGKIKIDQVFALLFNALRDSKISIIYHSQAVSSDFVTPTGERKVLPRWIKSMIKAASKETSLMYHWVVRPPKSAKLKTEIRTGNYTLVRYNSIPKKDDIEDIQQEELLITDLAKGLKQIHIPSKSNRITAELRDLILNSPEYRSSRYEVEDTDFDVHIERIPKTVKKVEKQYHARRPKISNSLWIMKYTCALKSVQRDNPAAIEFFQEIDLIRTSDFDEYYTKQDLHELHLKFMSILGLADTEIDEILDYFDMNSEYLGHEWLIAFLTGFIHWWKRRRDWRLLNRNQIIELISRVLSNQIVNSWISGSNNYDGKKAATLARKLSRSISLMDPRFQLSMDRVDKIIRNKPRGKMKIITHQIAAYDMFVGSIIILTISDIEALVLNSSSKLDYSLLDEFNTALLDLPRGMYEEIILDSDTIVHERDFIFLKQKIDYSSDNLKMNFTEFHILYNDEIYQITYKTIKKVPIIKFRKLKNLEIRE